MLVYQSVQVVAETSGLQAWDSIPYNVHVWYIHLTTLNISQGIVGCTPTNVPL